MGYLFITSLAYHNVYQRMPSVSLAFFTYEDRMYVQHAWSEVQRLLDVRFIEDFTQVFISYKIIKQALGEFDKYKATDEKALPTTN